MGLMFRMVFVNKKAPSSNGGASLTPVEKDYASSPSTASGVGASATASVAGAASTLRT